MNFVDCLIIISPFVLFRYNRIVNVYYMDILRYHHHFSEICGASRRPWVCQEDTVNTRLLINGGLMLAYHLRRCPSI